MKHTNDKVLQHPCFNRAAHKWFSCLHLPVALRCNIKCGYCSPGYDCPNHNPPGKASRVLTPSQAVNRLKKAVSSDPRLRVVGISGPGDSLANKETFETIRLINEECPGLIKCVSTNGLLLADKAEELDKLGVDTVHVTVNTVDPEAASFIYAWVRYNGEEYLGQQAASILLEKQLEGIMEAANRGIMVKVNCVLIPRINEMSITDTAFRVKMLGAHSMSIIPLNPAALFAGFDAPAELQLERVKKHSAAIIRQTDNYPVTHQSSNAMNKGAG